MRRSILAAVPLGALLVLTACSSASSGSPETSPASSSSSMSSGSADPTALVAKASAAAKAATAVHVHESGFDGDGDTTADLHFGATSMQGTLDEGGHTIRLLASGSTIYLKADNGFWTAKLPGAPGRTVIAKSAGRWLVVHKGDDVYSDFAGITSRTSFLAEPVNSGDAYEQDGTLAIGGQQTEVLKDSKDGSLVYVLAEGTPYPVQIVGRDGDSGGTETLSDWNVPFTADLPPAAQVVTYSTLGV